MTAQPSWADSTVDGYGWLTPTLMMAAAASGNWPLTARPGPDAWTWFPKIATRTLGAGPRSVRDARDFALATVRRWGAEDRGEDVALVVSELVTNVLRHALPQDGQPGPEGPVRFGVLQPGRWVLCAVADPSPRPPVPREPDELSETGRGLHVVGMLADAWGYTPPSGAGKIVWALFGPHDAAAHLPDSPRPVTTMPSAYLPTAGRDQHTNGWHGTALRPARGLARRMA